jgi:hypothetical protein
VSGDLTSALRDLDPTVVAALGAIAAFLVVLAVGAQLSARALRRELQEAEEELVDRETGLLPRSALRVRLGAELAWASSSDVPVAVAALRIRGSRFPHAARVLREAMREEEAAFLLGEQRVAVELWDSDPEQAAVAVRRLGEHLASAGHPVVDAGLAGMPRDGADVETLVAAAQRDLRPVDDPSDAGSDLGRDGRVRTAAGHAGSLLAGVLPWFAAMAVLLLLTWRLLPAAIEPAITGGRSGAQLAYALLAAIGIPIAAALLHASCWNLGGGAAPSSRPFGRATWPVLAAIVLAIGVPLAWGVFAPLSPADLADAFGASLAMLGLVVLVALHGRQLVHAQAPVLLALLLLGAAATWLFVEVWSHPVAANGGRLLAAAGLGALLARYVERASWIVVLALLASAVDVWSVYADSGVTNQVLDAAASGEADRLVELLLFTGPIVDGAPLFAIGVTDLVFLAMFLCWSHDWRLDMRVVTGAMVGAAWVTLAVGEVLAEVVPMLPFLGGAMVLVVAGRSMVLRDRVRRWPQPDRAA